MPLPPDLGGREHATGAALIAKGGLTSSMRPSPGHPGNTGHRTTWMTISVRLPRTPGEAFVIPVPHDSAEV
jgi:hypothetical protein